MLCLVYLLIFAAQFCAVVSSCHKRAKGVRQHRRFPLLHSSRSNDHESDALHHAALAPFSDATAPLPISAPKHRHDIILARVSLGSPSADVAFRVLRTVFLVVIQDRYVSNAGSAHWRVICVMICIPGNSNDNDDQYIDDDLLEDTANNRMTIFEQYTIKGQSHHSLNGSCKRKQPL